MANTKHDLSGTNKAVVQVPAVASGAATDYISIWTAPYACTITGMKIAATDTTNGAATNNVHFNVDGPSSTTEIGNFDLENGTNLTAGVASSFTMAANVDMTVDQSLRLEAEKIGTGMAVPRSCWIIEYRSN